MVPASKEIQPDNQARLAQLTAVAQREHRAFETTFGSALAHAMNAGDALLALREIVPPGQWLAYLRAHTDISERRSQVYFQVAKNRAELTRRTSAGPLSIAAALKYLQDKGTRRGAAAKSKPKSESKTTKSTPSLNALGWWTNAPPEERRHFLDGVGLPGILAALPVEWRSVLEERVTAHLSALRLLDLLEDRLERDGTVGATALLEKLRKLLDQSKLIDLKAVPVAGAA